MFTLAHFTVIGKSEKRVDHVLIQPFLLYYINYVVLMQTSTEKPLLSGPLRDLPSLIEVVKVAQCLLMINIQRLLCTVVKFHVVKKAKEAVLHFVQDF